MAHTHLVLAYTITIAVQLGYAGWVGLKGSGNAQVGARLPTVSPRATLAQM